MEYNRPQLNHLVVYPTLRCNLNCSYCYFHNPDKKFISEKKLLERINFFLNLPFKDKKITFLGGEPLIVYDMLKRIIVYIRNINKDILISIFTNGILLDKEKILFFEKMNVKIILSLDGAKKDNDTFRKYKSLKNSVFDKVLENIKGLENKISAVNMVVQPQTAARLTENVKFFQEKGFPAIGWNIDYSSHWKKRDIEDLKREMLELKLEYLKNIKNSQKIYEISNCYEVIENIVYNKTFDCSNIVLLPDGEFYFCDKVAAIPEDIASKFRFEIYPDGSFSEVRTKFFNEMSKKRIFSNQLFCAAGIYIFYRFVKGLQGRKLEDAVDKAISLMKFVYKEKRKFIEDLIKYPSFKEKHNI